MRNLFCVVVLTAACSSCDGGPEAPGAGGDDAGGSSGGDGGGTAPGGGHDGGSTNPVGGKDGGARTPDAGKDSGATGPKDASAPPPSDGATLPVYGPVHSGGEYELGPVEWTGSFWNQCGPYVGGTQQAEGIYLAGLDNTYNGNGSLCDACILMQTAKGKSIVLRVVTGGVAHSAESADLSKEAYDLINLGENPRTMTWQLVECLDTDKLQYQYQTSANTDWTSLWVRNGRVPVSKVEVISAKHASWFPLVRGQDGTLTDGSGFGVGAFQIRVTGMDGQVVTDSFASFAGGALVTSPGQFN